MRLHFKGRPQGQPSAPGGGSQPTAPSNGAPNGNGADYSAQWAEYYRSIGKVKEAEAIEAQMKQKVLLTFNLIIDRPDYSQLYF